jgi:hypothetical protein
VFALEPKQIPPSCLRELRNVTKLIVEAMDSFADWSRPWEFLASVLAYEGLPATDQELVRAVWMEACKSEHWCNGEPSAGSLNAERALTKRYPWLSTSARTQVVRAASYQWR